MMIEAQHISSDMRKIPASNLVFGVDLDEVEKDEKFTNIPKFVVECIKIIELDENIQTNGIYRASGKKESIDKLKKKVTMNLVQLFAIIKSQICFPLLRCCILVN